MLDADHVPMPDALDAMVGYFDDERVALVQSPTTSSTTTRSSTTSSAATSSRFSTASFAPARTATAPPIGAARRR